jgi:hypothetical protein
VMPCQVSGQLARKKFSGLPHVDAYAGLMFSEVNGGLANGYLHHSSIDPTVGLRFRFGEAEEAADHLYGPP